MVLSSMFVITLTLNSMWSSSSLLPPPSPPYSPPLQGVTKIALYGLGNIRDERLARLFQTPGCVQWWVWL